MLNWGFFHFPFRLTGGWRSSSRTGSVCAFSCMRGGEFREETPRTTRVFGTCAVKKQYRARVLVERFEGAGRRPISRRPTFDQTPSFALLASQPIKCPIQMAGDSSFRLFSSPGRAACARCGHVDAAKWANKIQRTRSEAQSRTGRT